MKTTIKTCDHSGRIKHGPLVKWFKTASSPDADASSNLAGVTKKLYNGCGTVSNRTAVALQRDCKKPLWCDDKKRI